MKNNIFKKLKSAIEIINEEQESTANNKLSALEKLLGTGLKTEGEFLVMSPADIVYSIPNINSQELHALVGMQDSIRHNNLFGYLCAEEEL